ncbi:MAG: DUF2786 domain-containing protein [Polyangiaceae bacterium]
MSAIDEVISKVKKLYALAEANTSENEAAVAIAAAEKLLQQYRLSRADVDVHSEGDLERPTEDVEPIETFASRIPMWQQVLVGALASHYGCVTYQARSTAQTAIRVVGCPSDVRLFRLQYSRVKAQIDRLTMKNGLGKGRSYCDSYRKGLVVVVHERLSATRAEVRQAATSTALVKLDERENLAAKTLFDTHANLRAARPTPMRVYADGYQAGKNDGHQIGLGEELASPVRGLPCPE